MRIMNESSVKVMSRASNGRMTDSGRSGWPTHQQGGPDVIAGDWFDPVPATSASTTSCAVAESRARSGGDPGVELDRSVPPLVLTWLEIMVLSLLFLSVQMPTMVFRLDLRKVYMQVEQQLQQERRLANEEKERLMQGMWAEKQSLLRAMSRLSETRSVDEAQLESSLRERVSKLAEELCEDKDKLQKQLDETRQELQRVRASQTHSSTGSSQAWEQEKAAPTERIRELVVVTQVLRDSKVLVLRVGDIMHVHCAVIQEYNDELQAEKSADDSVVQQVMEAVGSECSEATARRLLAACGNDSNKAARLANQALEALRKSWDQIDADASRPRGAVLSPFSQVQPKLRATAPKQQQHGESTESQAAEGASLTQAAGPDATQPLGTSAQASESADVKGSGGGGKTFSHLLPSSNPLRRFWRRLAQNGCATVDI